MNIKVYIAAAAILGVSLVSFAADGPHDKAIKARQGLMQVYSFNMGTLAGMAKGKIDYDAELAANAAANLHSAVSMKNGPMWPAGSDNSDPANRENRALPEIWSTYPKIAEKGKAMVEATEKLAAVAGNGLDELKSAMGATGKGCKGCHDDFRAKKE